MAYDFNILESKARELKLRGNFRDALNLYLFMADGDPSLDAGYLGEKIGECYEALGDVHSAKYWYGRAIEENPEVRHKSVKAREQLQDINIGYLIAKA